MYAYKQGSSHAGSVTSQIKMLKFLYTRNSVYHTTQ